MLDQFLSLLFPPRCIGCDRYVRTTDQTWCHLCACLIDTLKPSACCSRCGVPLKVLHHNPCASCRLTPPQYESAVGVIAFQGVAAQTIRGIKRNARLADAQLLGNWTRLAARDRVFVGDFNICVPPPHKSSLRERGFHLPWMLAKWWGYSPKDVLQRTRTSPKQADLDRFSRMSEIRGAFACTAPVEGTWIVVDDVMTTGATINEAARALRAAGANRVMGLALARVP